VLDCVSSRAGEAVGVLAISIRNQKTLKTELVQHSLFVYTFFTGRPRVCFVTLPVSFPSI